jgi:zinc protease
VDREKQRQIDALAQQENNPNAVAARVRGILAFGADHPYGRPAQGLPATVGAMTRDDLAAFHRDRWKPGSSALIFVGAVTLAEARALAQEHFGGWSGGAAPAITIPAPSPAAPGRIYLVDRQDAAQTVAQQFLPAPGRLSPDYYALMMADAVWGGGGFGTRLNLNLREDKGYSYGVFSNLVSYEQAGLWFAGGGVQTDKTAPAVAEFDSELKGLAGARPITREEFDSARQTKMRGYTQQFEAYARIAGQIANLWAQRLPMDELQREYDATAGATHDAALAAARTYARPDRALLLLVGDRGKIEGDLRALNLGEVVVIDSVGVPVAGAGRASP